MDELRSTQRERRSCYEPGMGGCRRDLIVSCAVVLSSVGGACVGEPPPLPSMTSGSGTWEQNPGLTAIVEGLVLSITTGSPVLDSGSETLGSSTVSIMMTTGELQTIGDFEVPGASGTTSSGSGSTTDLPSACGPDPTDDPCIECGKIHCCMQLDACLAEGDETTGCACFLACFVAGGDPMTECGGMCSVSIFAGGTPTGQLGACIWTNCNICVM